MKKYVIDTSAVIEKAVTQMHKKDKLDGTILIPHAVVSELENQGNKGLEIGFIGLEEIQEIRKLDLKIEFVGDRPNEFQIRQAKSGEIDALIRNIAHAEKATLITADLVQSESAKAFGLEVIYLAPKSLKEKLEIEKFFDETTMSIHLKAKCHPYRKKGSPGNWILEKVTDEILSNEKLQEFAKEIVERTRVDEESFLEISRRGSTIVQYKNYRIVIVKPPVSDGWEITVVRPIKKLDLKDYNLQKELLEKLKIARGVIIAGETGSGKSTLAQAIAEDYAKSGKITKTVESPRDLQLSDEITQYSKNFSSSQEIHDILFLSRPDYIVFDEMRDTPDFQLYTDIRLAGSNVLGVLHSATPIDAVQRFISRLDTGMIPSIVDTILFIENGKIAKVYTLKMLVKVPSGMTESDLARPVVDVYDFNLNKLEYEIYSYGEETVVVPVSKANKNSASKLAEKAIKNELLNYVSDVNVELVNNDRVAVYVPENEIAGLIGSKGCNIEKIEKKIGISIDVRELKKEKNKIKFQMQEEKKHIRLFTEKNKDVEIFIDNEFLTSAISSKKGEIKLNKQGDIGRALLSALSKNKTIELRA
ncbi:Flp pilus assembly complex ATPase component TadA [Candidatus Woesearchaeota archaeon]|nr:Flp pilus assembly complex ATPase component TadA [Candidatus Woesearchaeota archaeon]